MMSKVKVLVVDDEMEFATTLAERLSIRGFEADAVYCTEDALARIHANNFPDVVLLDLKMPHMDGMEALREIKQYNPSIEVIILTGHGAGVPLTGIDRGKHGAFDCVMKPADINELTAKINQAMAKRRNSLQKTGEGG
jgi:DNA-binding NtrC family response regulator